jgi:ribosomal protein L37AE/L43A
MSDTSTSTARDLTMRISPNGSAAGGHAKQCIECQARTIAGSMWRGIWHCPKCVEAKAARRAVRAACATP